MSEQKYSPMPAGEEDAPNGGQEGATNGGQEGAPNGVLEETDESEAGTFRDWERHGCLRWCPRGQTVVATALAFLAMMCALILSDAFHIGALSGALTSLETRYELKASQLGLVGSLYELGNLLLVLPLVHVVGRPNRRRPLWIGVGALTMAVGTALAASPQFIFGTYRPDARSHGGGNETVSHAACSSSPSSSSYLVEHESVCQAGAVERSVQRRESQLAYALVVLGEVLVGFGWTPVMPLSMSYIDDNVSTKSSALYIGIIQSMFGFGTIVGFLASASVSGKWVDFYRVDTNEIDLVPGDNLWVGAWWLGLAITSALYFLSALPFLGFPRQLRSRPADDDPGRFMDESRATSSSGEAEVLPLDQGSAKKSPQNRMSSSLLTLPNAIGRLLRNPIYMCLSLSNMTEMAVIAGLVSFFPKYLETQFGLSPPEANFFMAVVPVPAVALGSVVGGLLVRRLGLTAEGAIKLALSCSVISLVGQIALLGIGCDNTSVAGVDVPYMDSMRMGQLPYVNLTSACNVDCVCNPIDPDIVCGSDGLTYFSACHAGCQLDTNGTYANCSCVHDPADEGGVEGGSVVPGSCPMKSCSTLAPFLVIMFIIALSSSCEEIPQLMVQMRCVKKNDKSLSLGLRHAFSRIFGNIPAPLYYGVAIDATCRFWQQFCGVAGECWAYNLPDFRHAYMGLTVCLKALSAVSYAVTWALLRRRARGGGAGAGASNGGPAALPPGEPAESTENGGPTGAPETEAMSPV